MNYYKALLHEHYTKRDLSGNVYHVVKITNPRTGKSFKTEACSLGNVTGILNKYFGSFKNYYMTDNCTGSSSPSGLPQCLYLDNCRLTPEWCKELNKIGYKRGKK